MGSATETAEVIIVDGIIRPGDAAGAFAVRLGIGRARYRVEPGLYAIGSPGPKDPVLVSANYKLSFDALRQALRSLSAWILAIDTRGINVWCAAGKGSFSAGEIARAAARTGLASIVEHRVLILPQLAAPGVAAHAVSALTGFRVVYGPVRAADIPAFIAAGKVKTEAMSRVRFTLADRLVLAPVEAVHGFPLAAGLFAFLVLAEGIARRLFMPAAWVHGAGAADLSVLASAGLPALGALLAGTLDAGPPPDPSRPSLQREGRDSRRGYPAHPLFHFQMAAAPGHRLGPGLHGRGLLPGPQFHGIEHLHVLVRSQ